MTIFYAGLIIIIVLLSSLLVLFNLPGTFLFLFIVSILELLTNIETVTIQILLWFLGIVILLEMVEFFLAGFAVKVVGASKRSAVFAILGGIFGAIVGGIIFFLIGALPGMIVGSFFGAYFGEISLKKPSEQAIRAGFATLVGNMSSKLLKICTIIGMSIHLI